MISGITVNTNTYFVWQTVVAILTIISMGVSLYRAKKGTNKDEMTYFRDEVLKQFADLNDKVDEVREDVESTTQRLESHIDRERAPARPRARRKPAEE
jgi:hypothetical protein